MNIILIISDTFRYDNLFDRAAMPVRTPNLDAFAERAVSLSNMLAGSFPTIPERTDLISGRIGWPWYPWQEVHQSTQNLMPELLREQGYVSQLICDTPHLFNAGFHLAFDGAVAVRGQEADRPILRMNEEIAEAMPPGKTRSDLPFRGRRAVDLHRWTNHDWQGEDDRFPPRTARKAVQWLEGNYRFHPFLLWLDFFDPHEPWDPPECMVRKYDSEYSGTPMLHPNYGQASDYTEEELRNLRAHYCAEAELVDRWVGRVLQKIDDLDLWERSVVVFTTDHGMSLGEHNRTGKSNINEGDDRYWPIYPEIARLPFLIAAPGLEAGKTVDLHAQPWDILPTLLDLAGVQVENPEPFHGQSFAPQLRGESAEDLREFAVSGQFLDIEDKTIPEKATTPVLYTQRWAYIPIGAQGSAELYDLENDPYGENDVAKSHPDVGTELHGEFLGWLEEIGAPEELREVLKP